MARARIALMFLLTASLAPAGWPAQQAAQTTTPAPQVIAIKAGKLVNPQTGTTTTNQVILVEGMKIKAVGSKLEIPAGATVIDLSNSTVLPGLFDAHTHVGLTVIKKRDNGNHYFTMKDGKV